MEGNAGNYIFPSNQKTCLYDVKGEHVFRTCLYNPYGKHVDFWAQNELKNVFI